MLLNTLVLSNEMIEVAFWTILLEISNEQQNEFWSEYERLVE